MVVRPGENQRSGYRMRLVWAVLLVLTACGGPQVPNSGPVAATGSGVGSQDYNSFIRDRAAGIPATIDSPGTSLPAASGFSTDGAAAAIAAAEGGAAPVTGPPLAGAPLDATGLATGGSAATTVDPTGAATGVATGDRARGNAPAGIAETTAEMNFVTGGVSDEQDFAAVKSRETIASDAARIEANRAHYVVIQPGALPVRPGDTGPNIAEYAVATNNPVGEPLYHRPSFYLTNPVKACAKFPSPDLAQQAFLAAGGPARDTKALDPDGDGFACSWDPRPFRNALK